MTDKYPYNQGWSIRIRLLHWLTVAIVAAQVIIAFGFMSEPGIAAMLWLPLHMSVGVVLLGIIIIRLIFRAVQQAPARPLSRVLRRFASFVHISLYLLLAGVVVTGWSAYAPMPLMPPAHLFGILPFPIAPRLGVASTRDFASIHRILVWTLLILVGMHIAAAILHAVVRRDGVLSGMLFGTKRS